MIKRKKSELSDNFITAVTSLVDEVKVTISSISGINGYIRPQPPDFKEDAVACVQGVQVSGTLA